ncbi:DUF72 domain-containing protein [Lactobacillus sp. S2-2]|uniref:DUF72 domain-containing protein n=1 Tax=Lactobacillus sp. S2-2 TaxID=2692917 RepID=UPI001F2D4B5E|nr:DUF72 domain-containing protein [Lactobacillus sp. S2-2]
MISIGLSTWKNHPSLSENKQDDLTLSQYSSFFPIVEIDSSFYGIPTQKTVTNWIKEVPNDFQFVIKANQFMTFHKDEERMRNNLLELKKTFEDYKLMLEPLLESNQLKTVLFQFPPYFNNNLKNIRYLRQIRLWMPKIPITVEFRNKSWYSDNIQEDVANFLASLKISLAIVDEPHNLNNGVPLIPKSNYSDLVFIRLHGRNEMGWARKEGNWRATRTLYRYNKQELETFADFIKKLNQKNNEICIIFNNNSGRDAADNVN